MFNKPLLVFPPAPDRWGAIAGLLPHESALRLRDLEVRLKDGVPESQDAFALVPDGSKALAMACIRRRGAVGVFGQLFTREEIRGRGLCRQLVQSLLSWFDMTRGRWLFCHTQVELHQKFLTYFGFEPLQRVSYEGREFVTLLRTPTGVMRDPYARLASKASAEHADHDDGGAEAGTAAAESAAEHGAASGGAGGAEGMAGAPVDAAARREPRPPHAIGPAVRELTRADWPLIVALLQYRAGADPRVPQGESALLAENIGLEMFEQKDAGRGRVLGHFAGKWLTGVAGLAIAAGGGPTHALLAPHDRPNEELRASLEELARREGHTTVRYPLDALRAGG